MITIVPLSKDHFNSVSQIYRDGIETGIATFETEIPNWVQWNQKFLKACRYVAISGNEVIGWCALSSVSKRQVYRGVAEDTLYVASKYRGKGIGKQLLQHLIEESEKHGFWTLQAGIFSENQPSIKLHENLGFRIVGVRKKIAQRNGKWHDNVLMERRKAMKNILVLCTGNSCRSQMAHGYLQRFANANAQIYSAGIETHGLNPGAVSIMAEDGIDISNHTSNNVEEYKEVSWDFIITVCDHANENCPYIAAPQATRLHHNFFDPSKVDGSEKEKHTAFEKARDQIKAYCLNFVNQNSLASGS